MPDDRNTSHHVKSGKSKDVSDAPHSFDRSADRGHIRMSDHALARDRSHSHREDVKRAYHRYRFGRSSDYRRGRDTSDRNDRYVAHYSTRAPTGPGTWRSENVSGGNLFIIRLIYVCVIFIILMSCRCRDFCWL